MEMRSNTKRPFFETATELAGDADVIAIGGARKLFGASNPENVKAVLAGMDR